MEDASAPARCGRGPMAVVALIVLVLLGGCSPVSPAESARARQATSGSSGQMTFQLPGQPSAFDPFAEPDSANFLLAAAHFEPLVASVDGRLLPRMAVWWGTTDSGRGLRVQLKHGRWSDEERIAAADLIFTIEQHLLPGSRSPLLPVLLRISGAAEFHAGRAHLVDGLVAESARTAAITLTEPDSHYVERLTGLLVMPEHVYAGRELGEPQAFREPAVGSGAYLASAWSGDGTVTLTPNPRVDPAARLERVVGHHVPPTGVIDAVAEDTLDVATAIPGDELERIPDTHRLLTAPGDRLTGLSGRGPLADVRVRQAIAYAVDRQGLLARYLGGHGRVSDSALFQPDWATSPQRVTHPYDPERARALLVATDWRPDTEVRLVALTPDTDRAVWNELTRQLDVVGIRATITVRDVSDRPAVWADPGVDGVIDTYAMPAPDPGTVEGWVSCGSVSGYCNPRLDDLLAAGRTESEPTTRQDIYQQADRILSEELPVIPLWVPDAAVAVVNGRGGVNASVLPSTATIDYWGPA